MPRNNNRIKRVTKKNTFNILVAETDNWFRDKIKNSLIGIEHDLPGVRFNLKEAVDIKGIKAIFKKTAPRLALIEYSFFIKSTDVKQLAALIENSRDFCNIVMLISYDIDKKITKVLKNISKYPAVNLNGHLLKENYPKDLIRVLLKFFIHAAL